MSSLQPHPLLCLPRRRMPMPTGAGRAMVQVQGRATALMQAQGTAPMQGRAMALVQACTAVSRPGLPLGARLQEG